MIFARYKECPIVFNKFTDRKIKYAFHDIDGTHSLIREWPPVMSAVLNDVIEHGLPDGYDSVQNENRLISECGKRVLPETDAFCIESAGLSALTQMEWSIRRAIQEGKISVPHEKEKNDEIIKLIYAGDELFESFNEKAELLAYLKDNTPRLFMLYERVLNGYCRDKNLEIAKREPEKFIVPGSVEFMTFLKDNGVKNYFVTGAVVERGHGMYQEVETLGYRLGAGQIAEDIIGSTWDEKLPKNVIMDRLLKTLGASGDEVLVCGDGRSEISAGVKMGALCMSRLPQNASRQRQMHVSLGTDIIVPDYLDADIYKIFNK